MTTQDLKAERGELTLTEKLAMQRNVMALDRTLLAWERTALTLITFGFTIYKVLQFVNAKPGVQLLRHESPRNLGLFLECVGTFSLLFMMIDYVRMKRVLLGVSRSALWLNPHFLSASAIFFLGLFLLIGLLFNWSLL